MYVTSVTGEDTFKTLKDAKAGIRMMLGWQRCYLAPACKNTIERLEEWYAYATPTALKEDSPYAPVINEVVGHFFVDGDVIIAVHEGWLGLGRTKQEASEALISTPFGKYDRPRAVLGWAYNEGKIGDPDTLVALD